MGDLVAGQPALRIETAVSLPLDLVSMLSLLHRAVPGTTLDPWLVEARQRLPDSVRADLDLLHGFSGRLLYYPEEPVMRFQPLRADHREASIDELITYLQATPADAYREMVVHALQRVFADRERRWQPPSDEETWVQVLRPALTRATLEDAQALVADPEELKRRTVAMYEGVWDSVYRAERERQLPSLRLAAEQGAAFVDRGFAEAYAALTGQRLPEVLERPPPSITRITFCPSLHLGAFVSYIAYGADLVVFFAAPQLLDRCQDRLTILAPAAAPDSPSDTGDLLEAARALADPTRLRMIDLLLEGELYAQEIVGRLGVAQSAASRHLAQLERAGLVTVQARRGSKYYAVDAAKLEAVASSLTQRGSKARALRA